LAATAFRGAREILRPEEDALMSPCEDASALAQSIRRLAEQADFAKALAANGRQRLRDDFSRREIMAQYLELYARLAGESR
jgi:glycosyltransferase involved in cell wall biosynthesis